jgi:hypothetical protein
LKKLTSFLALICSFFISFGGISPAFAQDAIPQVSDAIKPIPTPTLTPRPVPTPPVFSVTNFYNNPNNQTEGVKVYTDTGFDVIIPNPQQQDQLPATLQEFNVFYPRFLQRLQRQNGINGSFTRGRFDFQSAVAETVGDELFEINAPLNGRIFSVVAGLPTSQCPVKIEDTQIAFYDKLTEALEKANDLAKQGYLVYVSPSIKLTTDAFGKIFYDSNGNKKVDPNCFIVSGATEKVTVDYRDIFPLLPPRLQQPARQAPFVFAPKRTSQFIYLVNARKNQ